VYDFEKRKNTYRWADMKA